MATVTVPSAFIGGFLNFYSIWIFCLMQVVPFLLAFLIGVLIDEGGLDIGKVKWRKLFFYGTALFAGFMAVFVSMGMVTTPLSKAIFKHMPLLNLLAGVFIGLAGCYLAGWLTLNAFPAGRITIIRYASGFLAGAGLAAVYKPCVTPTLTQIYNLAIMPDYAFVGAVLLVSYTAGISFAIMIAGAALAKAVSMMQSPRVLPWIKKGCGGFLLVIAFLILTDNMTLYKSYLVQGFVPLATGGAEQGEHHHAADN